MIGVIPLLLIFAYILADGDLKKMKNTWAFSSAKYIIYVALFITLLAILLPIIGGLGLAGAYTYLEFFK